MVCPLTLHASHILLGYNITLSVAPSVFGGKLWRKLAVTLPVFPNILLTMEPPITAYPQRTMHSPHFAPDAPDLAAQLFGLCAVYVDDFLAKIEANCKHQQLWQPMLANLLSFFLSPALPLQNLEWLVIGGKPTLQLYALAHAQSEEYSYWVYFDASHA